MQQIDRFDYKNIFVVGGPCPRAVMLTSVLIVYFVVGDPCPRAVMLTSVPIVYFCCGGSLPESSNIDICADCIFC